MDIGQAINASGMNCKEMLWTGNKCYEQGTNVVDKEQIHIPVLWTVNKCCEQLTTAVESKQMLRTGNKCFGQETSAVDRQQML